MKTEKSRRAQGWARFLGGGVLVLGLMLVGGYGVATQNPEMGAKTAMLLRGVFGDQAVAQLETIVYAIKDKFNQAEAQAGLLQAPTDWADVPTEVSVVLPSRTPLPSATPRPATPTPAPDAALPETAAPVATA
jgi:hypothetical protein